MESIIHDQAYKESQENGGATKKNYIVKAYNGILPNEHLEVDDQAAEQRHD